MFRSNGRRLIQWRSAPALPARKLAGRRSDGRADRMKLKFWGLGVGVLVQRPEALYTRPSSIQSIETLQSIRDHALGAKWSTCAVTRIVLVVIFSYLIISRATIAIKETVRL